jgi:hypothetical protein
LVNKPRYKTTRCLSVQDIDSEGNLVVLNKKGMEETLISGEVAIKYEKKH